MKSKKSAGLDFHGSSPISDHLKMEIILTLGLILMILLNLIIIMIEIVIVNNLLK